MCDTTVATGSVTAHGGTLFAKNSDREPSEPQVLEYHAPARHHPGATVRCTYLTVPQAARTHGTLLSRPYWTWGAEMAANDQGVVVGNEAVFTRVPVARIGLLGMDLVRLVAERADGAAHGVQLLAELLEEHGQGGAAGHRDEAFAYHNSFVIADADEAWVVETVDRMWAAVRVEGVRSISNGLTIRTGFDRSSAGLAARARDLGLSSGKGELDFARTFSDPLITCAAAARRRREATERCWSRYAGALGPGHAMAALRLHGSGPASGLRTTVCAHASWLPTRRAGQTTASLVSRVGRDRALHFVTATAAPCTSVFKPTWLDAPVDLGPAPTARFDSRVAWWRHEIVHRAALADLDGFVARIDARRGEMERRFAREADEAVRDGESAGERAQRAQRWFDEAEAAARDWRQGAPPAPPRGGPVHRSWWRALDERSGLAAAIAGAAGRGPRDETGDPLRV